MEAIPVLAGPTGSGKTFLALRLGEEVPVEVVSADATMVYRGLDIGTDKPTPEERARVPHHLVDVLEPHEAMSVARFLALAEEAIAHVLSRGKLPLVVGGRATTSAPSPRGFTTFPRRTPGSRRPYGRSLRRGALRPSSLSSPGRAPRTPAAWEKTRGGSSGPWRS